MVFIEFTDAPGSLSWTSCFHLAGFHGGRLPTHKEVKNLLHSKGFKPLFDTDIWIPVIDRPNCWVSVGNYDPATRLGRTHEKSCGAMPHWGETSAYHAFRTKLGIVHGRVTFVQTNGCLGYEAAMAHAAALGARLATKAEIRGVIEMHHNNPVFNYDVWVPVADKPHTWVSVGNYDPHVRLGRSHTRLFGIPDWTEDNGHYPFRSQLAVVPLISFVGSNGTRGWYAAADYAASLQCRLPYHDEVKRQIELLGNHPLFVSDVWIPVGDAPDTWVSVGNFDPETRLAKTHTFLFGIPPWSNDPTYYSFRTKIGLIPLSYNNIHTPTPIPTPSASDSGECTDATYDLAKLKL